MAKASPTFAAKDRINHEVFGTGTILDVNPTHTLIEFDDVGVKKFITKMVKLKSSDTPAPEKPVRRKKAKKKTKASK